MIATLRALSAAMGFVPGWIWAAICAGLIALYALTGGQLKSERLAHQTTKTAFADAKAQHADAAATAAHTALKQSEKYRAKEQELHDAEETHAKVVASLHGDLGRARARADAVASRLQVAVTATATRARAQCAAATSSDLREAAGDPIGVLADVLGRADTRAGILADLADRRGIAGRACERQYDEAREAVNTPINPHRELP